MVPIRPIKPPLPGPRDRLVNIGETGSGKSYAGLWHLSNSSFHVRPWVIVDPKNEDEIAQLDAREIELGYVPKSPGVYVVHPLPHELDQLDDFFMECWAKEDIGLFLDEAMFCGDGPGMNACLTQGRSKYIPMIINTQRPVEITRLAFNQASYFQLFPMNDKREMKTISNFIPDIPAYYKGETLPQFWSYYYDVKKRTRYVFKPVPKVERSISIINSRLNEVWKERKTNRI